MFWKSSPKFSFVLACWNVATLNRSAAVQGEKGLGSSRPYALICFNWNSSSTGNNSSGHWRTQLGRCGMHPGQEKAAEPVRCVLSRNAKAGVKLKPYLAEKALEPKQVISSLSTDFEAGLWDPVCFIWWNVEKPPPRLEKTDGNKATLLCACRPGFPSPFCACNWPDCTPSTFDLCNFLTNLSTSCNFPFYIIHESECLLILAPCKSNGSDCVIEKPWTGSQRSYSSHEQYSWHQKWVPLE